MGGEGVEELREPHPRHRERGMPDRPREQTNAALTNNKRHQDGPEPAHCGPLPPVINEPEMRTGPWALCRPPGPPPPPSGTRRRRRRAREGRRSARADPSAATRAPSGSRAAGHQRTRGHARGAYRATAPSPRGRGGPTFPPERENNVNVVMTFVLSHDDSSVSMLARASSFPSPMASLGTGR